MRFQRYRSVGLAALSSALVLLSANVSATSSTYPVIEDDSPLPEPVVSCLEDYLADGDCDPRNNREECGAWLFDYIHACNSLSVLLMASSR